MKQLNRLFFVIFILLVTGVACIGCRKEKGVQKELYVYLCLGQSNMEGHPKIETQDSIGIDERFIVLQAVDCPNAGYIKGEWRKAMPPLTRCYTGLSPADYFGRTMSANLPENIQVGVINVSIGGCRIELFDKLNYKEYVANAPDWLKNMVNEYNGNPYQNLVELANQAQEEGGIIKGILLHQGESNSGEQDWPLKVKTVYDNLLEDLNLKPNSIPLLAGELVSAGQNGSCAGMNDIINTLPEVIPDTYIISSEGCEGLEDGLHFSAKGCRELGVRYAKQMLILQNMK